MVKHVQITQNKKFTIPIQYLKKDVSREVGFLQADKHESFLQIDSIIFDNDDQVLPKFCHVPSNVFTMSRKRS